MDKKFIVLIVGLMSVCALIAAWAHFRTGLAQSQAAGGTAAYVERLFKPDEVIDIEITLAEEDLKNMMENPSLEQYKEASVVVDGQNVDHVAFRIKGNSSLMSVARSDSERYSFKIDFNQYISQQSLMGLTKLNLNNSFSDPSYMREYLSYALLCDMGVATPAFGYANVYVNGELIGLYLAVEGIEEPFVERYYGADYGSLYKPEGQGSDLLYIDDNIKSYSGIALVTKQKDESNANLLAMLKALNEGRDLEKYLDIDSILRYFAVNTVLVNMDSYQGNFKHNYYLYEENGVFTILPWDYNMSFGGFGGGGGFGGQGGGQNSTALAIDQPVSGTTLEQRPLLGKLLAVDQYKEQYHAYIKELIEGPFALDKMQVEIQRIADMIRPHLEKDPTKFFTMEQFEAAIAEGSSLQSEQQDSEQQNAQGGRNMMGGNMMGGNTAGLEKFVRDRIDNVLKQLSGEIPSTRSSADETAGMPFAGAPGQQGGGLPEGWQEQGRRGQRGQMPGGQIPDGQMPGGQMPGGGMDRPRGDFGQQPDGRMQPPGDMGQQSSMRQQNSLQNAMIVLGSVAVLVLLTLLAFKKKNKYTL